LKKAGRVDVIPKRKETAENRQGAASALTNRWGLAISTGEPAPLALADWLEELAVYGKARNPLDLEIAQQLSLAIENWYLVRLAILPQTLIS
jgi:hypothetical protein